MKEKTKEELNTLKEEVETVSKKLYELTNEELEQVTGGIEVPTDTVVDLSGIFDKLFEAIREVKKQAANQENRTDGPF